jgi:hypothetical protein
LISRCAQTPSRLPAPSRGCRGLSDPRSEGREFTSRPGHHLAPPRADRAARALLTTLALALALLLPACSSGYVADARLIGLVARAEFGLAREVLHTQNSQQGDERTDLLYATKRGMMALADGLPDAADLDFEAVFETLRTQGLNDDRTTESIFVTEEGTRIWKGEPFEQALAYTAIALADASRADWGNTRAAAENALFHLREYADTTTADDPEYQPVESSFALGYLLHGIAALEMHRREEAEESLAKAVASRPALATVRDTLLAGDYDTILVVDYGLGPRREAVGNGGVGVRYSPRTRSDDAPLTVHFADAAYAIPQACDVNEMSRDARWQSRESIRRFKQGLGEGLMIGGAVLATTGGTGGDDDIARLAIGAGLVALGAISQSNARADTRHNELLPQRVYIAPITLNGHEGPVRVAVESHAGATMTLHGLALRTPGEHLLRYVRLPLDPVEWADSPEILYANDATGPLDAPTLPWIMGGYDLRNPTPETALDNERAGLALGLTGDTLGEVRELYRAEGIRLFPMDDARLVSGHITEGGHSLYTPLPGTTGFTRLFAREHARYNPTTDQLRNAIASQNPQDDSAAQRPQEASR